MRRSFPLVLALAACGGNHRASEFVTARIPVTCALQARCGVIGASEVQGCIDRVTTTESEKRKLYDVDAAVRAGRLAFAGAHAGDCLAALYALDCGAYLAAIEPPACTAVLGPNVMPGGSCRASSECVNGTCKDLVPGCAASCVANPTTCDKAFECPPDQYCSATAKACKPRLAAGASCDDLEACQAGLFCDNRPDTCGGTGTAVCVPLVAQHGWCFGNVGCANGLGCQGISYTTLCGICEPWLDVGAQCMPGPLASNCPGGISCTLAQSTCPRTLPAEGDPCPMGACGAPTLWCDPGEMVCKRRAALGQPCTVGSPSCIEGSCEGTTHTCQPYSC